MPPRSEFPGVSVLAGFQGFQLELMVILPMSLRCSASVPEQEMPTGTRFVLQAKQLALFVPCSGSSQPIVK